MGISDLRPPGPLGGDGVSGPGRPPLGWWRATARALMDPTTAEDLHLMGRIAAGDREAFARLFDHHSPLVLGYLVRILGSRSEAEEVLQEVFLQVWRQASRPLNPPAPSSRHPDPSRTTDQTASPTAKRAKPATAIRVPSGDQASPPAYRRQVQIADVPVTTLAH